MTSLGSRHHQERQVAEGAFYQTSLEPWNHLGKCLNKFQDSNDASSHFIQVLGKTRVRSGKGYNN